MKLFMAVLHFASGQRETLYPNGRSCHDTRSRRGSLGSCRARIRAARHSRRSAGLSSPRNTSAALRPSLRSRFSASLSRAFAKNRAPGLLSPSRTCGPFPLLATTPQSPAARTRIRLQFPSSSGAAWRRRRTVWRRGLKANRKIRRGSFGRRPFRRASTTAWTRFFLARFGWRFARCGANRRTKGKIDWSRCARRHYSPACASRQRFVQPGPVRKHRLMQQVSAVSCGVYASAIDPGLDHGQAKAR